MKRSMIRIGAVLAALALIAACASGPAAGPARNPSPRPEASSTIAVKADDTQRSVVFTLTSAVDGDWLVYDVPEGGKPMSHVSAAFNPATRELTLTARGGLLPAGPWYVSVRAKGRGESGRLALTVAPQSGPMTGLFYTMFKGPVFGDYYDFTLPSYDVEANWVVKPGAVYDGSKWAAPSGDGEVKKADVFFLLPTTYIPMPPAVTQKWAAIDDPVMRAGAQETAAEQFGVFRGANMYAPHYRQLPLKSFNDLGAFSEHSKQDRVDDFFENTALLDAKLAFEYYLAHYDKGRPIIFAGHSQGSMVHRTFIKWLRYAHPEVLDRMIAAYLIGSAVEQAWIDEVGLKFAAGPDDTGVVISYNTEAEGVADTAINGFTDTILGGLSINPITWSTERGKEAGVSREDERVKGSRFSKDKVWRDYPHFTGAYIHPERGTIIAPMDIAGYDYAAAGVPALTQADGFMSSFWAGPSSLHGNDYKLFYYDLQANVDARIEAWYRTHP